MIVIPWVVFFNSLNFIFDFKRSYDVSENERKETRHKYLHTDFQNCTPILGSRLIYRDQVLTKVTKSMNNGKRLSIIDYRLPFA